MIGIPAVQIVKDRPLEPGHRLYAIAGPGRRRQGATCAVHCSCGERLVIAEYWEYKPALYLAARNHRRFLGLWTVPDVDPAPDPVPQCSGQLTLL